MGIWTCFYDAAAWPPFFFYMHSIQKGTKEINGIILRGDGVLFEPIKKS